MRHYLIRTLTVVGVSLFPASSGPVSPTNLASPMVASASGYLRSISCLKKNESVQLMSKTFRLCPISMNMLHIIHGVRTLHMQSRATMVELASLTSFVYHVVSFILDKLNGLQMSSFSYFRAIKPHQTGSCFHQFKTCKSYNRIT